MFKIRITIRIRLKVNRIQKSKRLTYRVDHQLYQK